MSAAALPSWAPLRMLELFQSSLRNRRRFTHVFSYTDGKYNIMLLFAMKIWFKETHALIWERFGGFE
jgi:hypothetical protein